MCPKRSPTTDARGYRGTGGSVLRRGRLSRDAPLRRRQLFSDADFTGCHHPRLSRASAMTPARRLVQLGAEPFPAGTVPRPDAGVQGFRDAADRPALRGGADATWRACRPSSAPPPAIPDRRRSRRSGGSMRSMCSSSFPQGRVSEVQRRQMTTPTEANVHALAVARRFRRLPGQAQGHVQRLRLPRRGAAGRRQLDQLGAGAGAGGLLLHRRRVAGRAASPGQLHRADRQFRRHLRRLYRAAAWACRSKNW